MSSGRVTYSEISKDGLRARSWAFFATFDGGDLHVVLDSYSEGTRESSRQKFRENGRFYERLGRATHGETRLLPEELPWPPYPNDKTQAKWAAMVVISRKKDFGRDTVRAEPSPDATTSWDGAQETPDLPMKRTR